MSLPDLLIIRWFTLATVVPLEKVAEYERSLKSGANPKDIKQALAFAIVERYHGEKSAAKAAENWKKMFSQKDLAGADIPEWSVASGTTVVMLAKLSGVAKSNGEARRLVLQHAVTIGGEIKEDPNEVIVGANGKIAKIGKKTFLKLKQR